jgi:nitrate reductase NapE component
MRGRHHFIVLAFLAFCLLPLLSCASGGGGSALQAYAPVAAQPPGTARVWFMHVNDPQEQAGDPIIYANGNQVGRSIPGIAFYHDFPPGTYAFTVQSYGLPTGTKDVVQLAPGTQTYLEILWGGSWLIGTAGGATYYVRTLPPELASAYLHMLTDKGPPQAI